jgi:hypothetical protein
LTKITGRAEPARSLEGSAKSGSSLVKLPTRAP